MQGGGSIESAVGAALSRQTFAPEASTFVRSVANGAVTAPHGLDAKFAPYLKSGWTPERLALVDLLILRIAVFELWHLPEMPPKVTITEAVSLAKRFGGKESSSFVNGVLAKVLEASPKADWEPGRDGLAAETPVPAEKASDTSADEDVRTTSDDAVWTIKSEG